MALSLTAVVSMTGCSSAADQIAETETTTAEGAKLLLSVAASSTSTSRSDATGIIDGTSAESSYSKITVIFVDANGKIANILNKDVASSPSTVIIPLDGVQLNTTYTAYVAANLSATLNVGDDIATLQGAITEDVSNNVAKANNFLMTGQVKVNGNTSFTILSGEYTHAAVSLDRVVAKVIVTAATQSDGYIPELGSDGVSFVTGSAFVKPSDIEFTLMTTNKKFYYIKNLSNGTVVDPNFNMDEWATDFSFASSYKAAQDYTWADIINNKSRYTDNTLYCLENTTTSSSSWNSWNAIERRSNPKKVTTYLHIRLKAVPRTIWTSATASTNYSDPATAIASLDNKTYYTYLQAQTDAEKRMCFKTKDALKAKFSKATDEYIKSHSTDEYFTYDVFVNGKDFDATNSSIIRNYYYIVKINSLATPYVDQVMEFNTAVVNWNTMGTTNQNVDSGSTGTIVK